MNDLYFFFKIRREHPCSQGFAPRQRHPGRFSGLQGCGKCGRRIGVPAGGFGLCFLPEHPICRAEADLPGQLHGSAALLHQLHQQPDIFFFRVPHRGRQTVQGRFQNGRIRCRQHTRSVSDRRASISSASAFWVK